MDIHAIKNPYTNTKQFWYRAFHDELILGDKKLAEENFLRYRYWVRREKLWDYLGQLCKEKEFGNAS